MTFLKSFLNIFRDKTWDEVSIPYDHPSKTCLVVKKHLRYFHEKKTEWRQAPYIWKSKQGDCKDFAVCIQALCLRNQFKTKLYTYYKSGSSDIGHAVLVGTWNEKLWFSSNGSYEEANTMKDVDKYVAKILDCKAEQVYAYGLSIESVNKLIWSGRSIG